MTKESEEAFVIIYSEYLRRRSYGTAKNQAVQFEDAKIYAISEFKQWDRSDISSALQELRGAGYLKIDILGNIALQNSGIEYMESKPKEYFSSFVTVVKDLLSLASTFLPI